MSKTIVIGCDNAAVPMKNALKQFMVEKGYTVEDMGCNSPEDPVYYPYIAKKACQRIIDSNYTKEGVLICGTGLGMAMTANKFPGIRAGVCHDSFSGERLKLSNNGNVICFGERVIGIELAKKILAEWLDLEFKDGSSTPKVSAIKEVESETMKES
jgi:ribose 5-phosphate isomerase B